MRLTPRAALRHAVIGMEEAEAAETIRRWMVATMTRTGWSARKWALQAGIGASAVQKAVREDYGHVSSTKTLTALAKAAGVSPPDLTGNSTGLTNAPLTPPFVELPIRYDVAAGAWKKVDELAEEPIGYYAEAHRIKGYEHWPQWLERVVGDSYDRKIPDGSLVHVVDAIAMGYAPRHGDTVVVVRRSGQGSFLERSLKQVVVAPFGLELWPQSHNPAWDQPLNFSDGAHDADVEVEIVGKVLRAYQNLD